jgi:hypothetical protein
MLRVWAHVLPNHHTLGRSSAACTKCSIRFPRSFPSPSIEPNFFFPWLNGTQEPANSSSLVPSNEHKSRMPFTWYEAFSALGSSDLLSAVFQHRKPLPPAL